MKQCHMTSYGSSIQILLRRYIERFIGRLQLKKNIKAIQNFELKTTIMHILSNAWISAQTTRFLFTFKTMLSWPDVIEVSIDRILNKREKNILAFGYRKQRKRQSFKNSSFVEAIYPNTLVNTLNSPAWEWLHRILGDAMMIHMLSECSLFIRLKHNCYYQLTGYPMYEKIELGEDVVRSGGVKKKNKQ
jgi:hypothetical protein